MSRDEWRITSGAIEMEMERIAGLLQKSAHFQSRNKIGCSTSCKDVGLERHETERAPKLIPDLIPELSSDLVHKR